MTQKQSTSILSTGKKLLRLGVVISLAFALSLTLLLFPVLAGTALTVPGAGFGFNLPFGAELVQASNGLTITKTAPVTVTQGGLITYTIRLTNQTGSAFVYPPRLVVTDIVPAKTTCVWVGAFPLNFTGYDATQCQVNGVAHLELKNVTGTTFANNATAVFSFAVQTDLPLPDGYVITNSQYSVQSDLGNSDFGTSVPTIVYAPKFAISKVANPSPAVNYGDPVTYTITVTNIGHADATGIVVTDTVPTNTNLSDAGGGSASGGIITWNIAGPLAPNATQVITFAVTANGAGLSIGDKIVNSKYGVKATNVHTDDWAMGSPVTVTVDGTVVLTATKLDVPDPVELVKGGSLLTYTIEITNGATAGVSDVTFVDTLPAEVKLVRVVSSLTPVTGTNLAGQTVLTFTPAVINAGATVQATVVVSVTAPQKNGTTITNTLAVNSPSADTITINGVTAISAPVTTLIYSQPAITLTKSVQPTEATFGSLLTYTVMITNNGADDRLVDVTDDLTNYLGSGFWPINTIGGAPAGDLDRWDIPVTAGTTVSFTFHALVGSITSTALIDADFNAAATFGDVGFGEAGVGTSVGNWFTSASNPAQITAPSVNRRLSSINQVDATNCSLLYLFTVMDYTPPSNPNARQGEIQISNDGATWQTIETLRESTNGVGLSLIDVKQYATNNFRIGYLYSGSGSAVTGGWDIQGSALICVNPETKDTAVYDRSVYYNTAVAASYLFTTTDTTDVISDTAPVTVYASTITMTKSVNPGTVDLSSGNQVVTYTYEVFNTGNVPVYWTNLVDDKVNTSGVSYPVTWIAPGDSDIVNIPVTITGSYITGALPVTLTNTATATVESVSGTTGPFGVLTSTATATTSLVITYTPNINISKSAEASNGFPAVKGDIITYTITITNPGVRAVTVSSLDDVDSLGNSLNLLGSLTSTTIAAGEVRVVTRTLTLNQADITNAIADGYLISNTVDINVNDSVIGVTAIDSDTVVVPVDASIDVTLSKRVSPAGPVTIGDVVTYTFVVTNSGSAPLDNVDLDDTVLGYADTIPGGSLPLAPDAVYTFTLPVVIDEALFNLAAANGFTLTNTAVATGTNTTDPLFTGDEATSSSSVDLPITHTAAISVVKIATYSPSPVGIDQPITYTYRIINTGNLTFTDVVQAQDVFNISFIMLPGGDTIDLSAAVQAQLPLAPGGVITVTSSVAPTEDDIAAVPGGNLTNTVTIELQHNPSTVTALANASATVPVTSTVNLVLTKTATVPGGTVQPGELITYTYTVYNPNTVLVRLSPGFLTDSDSASLTFNPALPGGTISVFAGSTRVFTATRRFTYTDWVNTPSLTYTNYATVTGATLAGTSATAHASASVTLDYLLNVDVLKVASYASSPVGVGQTITYTVYITNNGYVPFDVTSVYDTLKGGTLTPGATVLSPTKSTTAVFTRTVTLADVLAGSPLVNTAIVTATDKTVKVNQTDVDGDSEAVPIAYGRFVDLDKSVSSTYVTIGDTVVYTFTVTNNSGVGVTYSLTDTALSFYWPAAPGEVPLAAGATAVFTKSKLVGASDLPIFTNVATVTARVPSLPAVPRLTVTDSVVISSYFTPTLALKKTGSLSTANIGDSITYSFNFSNTSTVWVNNTSITDPKLGFAPLVTVNLPPNSINVAFPQSANHTFQASDFTLVNGQWVYTNVAYATGTGVAGAFTKTVTATDVYTVVLNVNPAIQVTKVADRDPAGNGQVVNYSFIINNSGSVPFTGVTLYDPLVQPTPAAVGAVAAGSTITVTLPYTLSIADANAGLLTNTVWVTGTSALTGVTASNIATKTIVTRRVLTDVVITTAPTLPAQVAVSQLFTATIAPNIPQVQPVTYNWNFGDGLTAGPNSGITTTHTYTAPGTYTVTVVAANGVSTVTNILVVTVQNQPIVINSFLNDSPAAILPGGSLLSEPVVLSVTLQSGTGTILYHYQPDCLGDPYTTINTLNPSRIAQYQSPGVYVACVTVDNGYTTATATTTVIVTSMTFDKDATPAPGSKVAPGNTITYRLTITNANSTPSVTVGPITVTDYLPVGVTYNSVSGGATLIGGPDSNNVITFTVPSIAAGGSWTAFVNATVNASATNHSLLTNTATAYSPQVNRGTITNTLGGQNQGTYLYDFGTDAVAHEASFDAELSASKTVNNSAPNFGDTITYTIRVTNTGTMPLTVTVTDPGVGGTIASNVPMAVGASQTYIVSDVVDMGYLPTFRNVVTTTGQLAAGGNVITTASVVVTPNVKLTFDVQKIANPTVATLGDKIQYSFRVTNLGPITLTTVSLYDALLGGNLGVQFVNVAPFSQTQLSAVGSYTVTESDLLRPNAQIVNTAIATASNPSSGLADQSNTAVATVTLAYTKSLAIQKIASRSTFNGVGQSITYTFIITNQGNVPLYNVHVVDPLTSYATTIPSLAAGASTNAGPASYSTLSSDLAAGVVVNTVTAAGSSIISGDLVTGTATVTVTALPNMSISKSALAPYPSGSDVVPGNQIVYQLTIANNGGPANNAQITDQLPADVTLVGVSGSGVVASGNSITITTSLAGGTAVVETRLITVTVNDISSASTVISNQAILSATATLTQSNSVTHTVYGQPKLQITKSAVPVSGSSVETGQTIVYTLVVTNIGAGVAKQVAITDALPINVSAIDSSVTTVPGGKPVLGHLTGNDVTYDLLLTQTLAAGEHFTVMITGTVKSGLAVGTVFSNTAYAEFDGGTPLNAVTAITNSNTVTHVVVINSNLAVSKTVNDFAPSFGDTITYTIRVTNTGTVPLTVTVTDPNLGGTIASNVVMAVGANRVYNITDTVGYRYVPLFLNVVTATGQVNGGSDVITSASVVVIPNTKLTFAVDKVASPSVATVGDVIQYSLRVRNLGPITLTTVSLYDALFGGNLGFQFTNVAPFGQSPWYGGNVYTVTESDLLRPNAQIVNTAIATASNPTSGLADQTATGTATVTLIYTKSLAIQKIASRSTVNGYNQPITYTFVVTNEGNVPLYNVSVVDPLTSYATTIPSLAAGAHTSVGPASYNTQVSDLQAGLIVNTATAAGSTIIPGDLVTDTDTVTVTVLPNMSISKSALAPYPSGSDVIPGNQIVYQLTIANSGGPANNAQITDQLPAELTLGGVSGSGVVASGNTITVTTSLAGGLAVYETRLITVTVNDISSATETTLITNQATLSATATLTQSNSVTHTIYWQPKLQITKSAVPVSGSTVETGQTIVYTLVITNIGSGSAKNMVITDTAPVTYLTVTGVQNTALVQPGNVKGVSGHQTLGSNVTWFNLLPGVTLAPGEYFTVQLTATVNALPVRTVISNTADGSFVGGTSLVALSYITNSNTVTHVTAAPDLQLVKTASAATVETGGKITYTIVVSNAGLGLASGVVITDNLDSRLNLVSASGSSGSVSTSGNAITLTTSSLAKSAYLTVTVVATVATNVTTGTQIVNTASVNCAEASADTGSVTITVTTAPTSTFIYLPIIVRGYTAGPNLVVNSVRANQVGVEVVIENIGNSPTSLQSGLSGFWVDFYANITKLENIPTGVNQTWNYPSGRSSEGVAWLVTGQTLDPGETLTLTCNSNGSDNCTGTYVVSSDSKGRTTTSFNGISSGTTIYAQVDSASTEYPTTGAVVETHELVGGTYDNIGSGTSESGTTTFAESLGVESTSFGGKNPARPR